MFKTGLALAFMVLATQSAAFDATGRANTLVSDWQSWMKKYGIKEGAVIVSFEGNVVAESGIARSVDDPAKVASLSKTITAVCALKAAESAGESYRTKLPEAIPAAMSAHPPRDKRFAEITIGQLITHTSGITSRYHRSQLEKLKSFGKEDKLWQFSKLGKEALAADPGKAKYHYTNANYLTLGLAIEELTGEDYQTYCQKEVLEPAGVTTAKLNETWTVMSSWGGWEISARDFLNFAENAFTGENSSARPAGYFLPAAALERGRSYGAGTLYRRTAEGTNTWHTGSWNWKGRIRDRFGAYFAIYDNGFAVVTNYDHDAYEGSIQNELDALLYNATHP